jgi:alkylation response protein AidB-like acyl-CoA dehydrogenase
VRFAFTDDQLLFRDAVRDFLAKECTPAVVRHAWESETGRSRELWSALTELGVIGLTVPEEHGGLGLAELDLVLLLEETGRAALAEPVVETTAVAAPLLVEMAVAGPDVGVVATPWLERIASGEAVVTIALGGQSLVTDAHVADLLIVGRADRVVAVSLEHAHLEPQPSVDGARRIFDVIWDPADEQVLATGQPAARAIASAFDRAALGVAAQLVGLGDHLLETTVAYVVEREQFGGPVGSFQAVKHQLADALLKLEFAKPAVHRAAHSVADAAPMRSRDVSMAKALASDAARFAAGRALQCHGAIGYTVEYDLHLWMKRVWALAAAWGDAAWHRRRVASSVLGPGPAD